MSAHRPAALAVALLTIAGLIGTIPSQAAATPQAPAPQVAPTTQPRNNGSAAKAVFFAADGMRQDLVERFAAQGTMPTMRTLLRNGVKASGNGLLTQAPPNTGAGWYTLATGAWPGVAGSTNNTFHTNGAAFATARNSAFDAGTLQVETIAQSAERGGLKVAQVEWAGGANATINGPTVDYQTFHSGRGVTTNFIGTAGLAAVRRRGPDQRPSACSSTTRTATPARTRSRAPHPRPASGWTNVPALLQPGPRRCACGCWTPAPTSTA